MPEMHNIDMRSDGIIRPRKSFKTFWGMVWQLWLINRRYTKMGVKGSFSVTLPLPEGKIATSFKSDMVKFK